MIKEKKLLPMFKRTGWKRKEIEKFKKYYPNFINNNEKYTFVEPFFWGWAVFWNLQNNYKNIINDFDKELIIFIKEVKKDFSSMNENFEKISNTISNITIEEKEWKIDWKEAKTKRWLLYYKERNKDKDNWLKLLSDRERAIRFFVVNQLSFNWMRRFNRKWEFNIPYGNYKTFNCNIKDEHVELLKKTEIRNEDYKKVMLDNDNNNTFIFLDPPYTREFTEYSYDNIFWNEQQIELFNIFKNMKKAKVMIIINKDNFTTNLYKDYIKEEYALKYSTNIKNRFNNEVKHLIITNY